MSLAEAHGAGGGERLFRFQAVGRDGRARRDVITAVDQRQALRKLEAEGLTVTALKETAAKAQRQSRRPLKAAERVLVLRQLALMLDAGVPLLEALEAVTAGLDSAVGRAQFSAVAAALRRGDSFSHAFETHAPGFPFYVYAMSRVGEASGRIPAVIRDASEQMAAEDRLRRDFINAMTYPAFLASAGVFAILFIFTQVVPRFSTMIGGDLSRVPTISRIVLEAGTFTTRHGFALSLVGVALAALVVLAAANPSVRRAVYDGARSAPVLGAILKAREVTAWARLTSFALAANVPILEAIALARQVTPPGAFQSGLGRVEGDLRGGVALDASLAQHTDLNRMDLSLVRTGQRSGALARMFASLADSYEDRLRDLMKRFTALVEPLAIGGISVVVGIIALSLVLALSSVYDTVS